MSASVLNKKKRANSYVCACVSLSHPCLSFTCLLHSEESFFCLVPQNQSVFQIVYQSVFAHQSIFQIVWQIAVGNTSHFVHLCSSVRHWIAQGQDGR